MAFTWIALWTLLLVIAAHGQTEQTINWIPLKEVFTPVLIVSLSLAIHLFRREHMTKNLLEWRNSS